MELQRLLSHVRKAVDDYSLIDDGDSIAVGISGGKDERTSSRPSANARESSTEGS